MHITLYFIVIIVVRYFFHHLYTLPVADFEHFLEGGGP